MADVGGGRSRGAYGQTWGVAPMQADGSGIHKIHVAPCHEDVRPSGPHEEPKCRLREVVGL